ncbi:MAG TPA: hypothetical protein VMW16_04055 [Sedimentisphaerales bacterium]|nr:hypothetical protein [Sedimentisphaerales bacterium]
MKRDALVVLGCLVFVLANLGAVGSGGRRRAKEVVCLSNLKRWATVWQMFLDDNDKKFMSGNEWVDLLGPEGSGCPPEYEARADNSDHAWWLILSPYYKNYGLLCCPEASERPARVAEGERTRQDTVFSTWALYIYCPDNYFVHGSYGLNSWIYNRGGTHNAVPYWNRQPTRKPYNVPLVLDCFWCEGFPLRAYEPPPYHIFGNFGSENNFMWRFCVDRHNGATNSLFCDLSVRKVGLKELWELDWHPNWNPNNDPPPVWPEWMKNFKDY